MLPSITTIIPTYNRSQLLKRAINSVLNQTFQDFQIFVFDNASEDDTEQIVKELAQSDPRIKYFRHEKNIGLTANFKFGLSKVETPFFSFLSDDNRLFTNFYEIAINKFSQHPDAGVFIGDTVVIEEGKKDMPHCRIVHGAGYYPSYLQNSLDDVTKLFGWDALLFSKKAKDRFKTLGDNVDVVFDIDFLWKVVLIFPFIISKERCATFEVRYKSASANIGIDRIDSICKNITQNLKELCKNADQRKIIEASVFNYFKRDYMQGVAALYMKGETELSFNWAKLVEQNLPINFEDKIKLAVVKFTCKTGLPTSSLSWLITFRKRLIDMYRKIKHRNEYRELRSFLKLNGIDLQ